MAKGYIVADINVRDKEGFEKFREMALPVVEEYGTMPFLLSVKN